MERALSPNRDNFLELDVYFEEMQVTLITQRQAYDQESLFGELYRATPSHEHNSPRCSQCQAASPPAYLPVCMSVCRSSVGPSLCLPACPSVSVFLHVCLFMFAGF